MAAPSMTFNAAGNVRASSALAAAGTATYSLDYSIKIEGQITIKNTPGGTVATTRGLRVDIFPRYGAAAATTTIPAFSYTLPSAVASTAESKTVFVATGQWAITLTNLDVTNGLTAVEITDATVDGIA